MLCKNHAAVCVCMYTRTTKLSETAPSYCCQRNNKGKVRGLQIATRYHTYFLLSPSRPASATDLTSPRLFLPNPLALAPPIPFSTTNDLLWWMCKIDFVNCDFFYKCWSNFTITSFSFVVSVLNYAFQLLIFSGLAVIKSVSGPSPLYYPG